MAQGSQCRHYVHAAIIPSSVYALFVNCIQLRHAAITQEHWEYIYHKRTKPKMVVTIHWDKQKIGRRGIRTHFSYYHIISHFISFQELTSRGCQFKEPRPWPKAVQKPPLCTQRHLTDLPSWDLACIWDKSKTHLFLARVLLLPGGSSSVVPHERLLDWLFPLFLAKDSAGFFFGPASLLSIFTANFVSICGPRGY